MGYNCCCKVPKLESQKQLVLSHNVGMILKCSSFKKCSYLILKGFLYMKELKSFAQYQKVYVITHTLADCYVGTVVN